MKAIQKLVLTVFMCGVMGAPLLYAQDKGGDKQGKMAGGRESKIFSQLNLTEDQKKQLDTNKKAQMQDMKGLFQQMKTLSRSLNEELMKSQLDMAKVNSINTQLKTLQGQIADKRIDSIIGVRKILTPEQFSKFLALTEEMRNKRRGQRHGDEPVKKQK